MRYLMLSGMLLVATAVSAEVAEDSCASFAPFGDPVHRHLFDAIGIGQVPKRTRICHTGQVVAFNPERNVSDWVAYQLHREDLHRWKAERPKDFPCKSDRHNNCRDLGASEEHQVECSDYTHTGYDRGHFALAGAMRWPSDAMSDSCLMTTIAPMMGDGFNGGIWNSLERKMRQWACERGTLYVVTGPLYENRPVKKIGNCDGRDDNGVSIDVPSHFFKFAFDPGNIEAIAFILPNRKLKTKDLPRYLTSVDDIEARSRLDFMTEMWDGAEQVVEAHVQRELWDRPVDKRCQ